MSGIDTGFGGNYAEESPIAAEARPQVGQLRWVRAALDPSFKPKFIPREHPNLQKMLEAQGLSLDQATPRVPHLEFYADWDRPDHDES